MWGRVSLPGYVTELVVISVDIYHRVASGVCHFFYLGGERVGVLCLVSKVRVLSVAA